MGLEAIKRATDRTVLRPSGVEGDQTFPERRTAGVAATGRWLFVAGVAATRMIARARGDGLPTYIRRVEVVQDVFFSAAGYGLKPAVALDEIPAAGCISVLRGVSIVN